MLDSSLTHLFSHFLHGFWIDLDALTQPKADHVGAHHAVRCTSPSLPVGHLPASPSVTGQPRSQHGLGDGLQTITHLSLCGTVCPADLRFRGGRSFLDSTSALLTLHPTSCMRPGPTRTPPPQEFAVWRAVNPKCQVGRLPVPSRAPIGWTSRPSPGCVSPVQTRSCTCHTSHISVRVAVAGGCAAQPPRGPAGCSTPSPMCPPPLPPVNTHVPRMYVRAHPLCEFP